MDGRKFVVLKDLATPYRLYDDGTVYNPKTGTILKQRPFGGYLNVRVRLKDKRKDKTFFIHRMVAEYFLPKVAGLKEVNHINGDKYDNRVENLEWICAKGNVAHHRTLITSLKLQISNLENEISELQKKKNLLLQQEAQS